MRWTIHGERSLYDSEWVCLRLVDVELPDGTRFEHHVVRHPQDAAGVVITDPARGVLLLWRHRFITDTWGWEIPAGRVEPGEEPQAAAIREALEETGWAVGGLRRLGSYHPNNGTSDLRFHLFTADRARHVGPPSDEHEAERIDWVPRASIRRLIDGGQILDGMSVTGLLWALSPRA